MFSLLVNLYEFGQFLRILLWIFLPMVVVAMLVTTWLHYRRKRKTQDEMTLSMEGLDLSANPEILIAAMRRMPAKGELELAMTGERELAVTGEPGAEVTGEPEPAAGNEQKPFVAGGRESAITEEDIPEEAKDRMYRGILWMKEKYEQYRDLADQRIEQLKEELAKIEKKYQDLLDAQPQVTAVITSAGLEVDRTAQLESRYAAALQQLEEKDRNAAELQSQLQVQRQKTEELIAKLQHNSQLLLNISRELDTSVLPSQPQA